MNQNDANFDQRRQAALQNLRDRRSRSSPTPAPAPAPDVTTSESLSSSNPAKAQHTRARDLNIEQLRQIVEDKPELLKSIVSRLRDARQTSGQKGPDSQLSGLQPRANGEQKAAWQSFLGDNLPGDRPKSPKLGMGKGMLAGLMQDVQPILTSNKIELTDSTSEELEAYSQRLQMRSEWLQSVVAEIDQEVQRIRTYLATSELPTHPPALPSADDDEIDLSNL